MDASIRIWEVEDEFEWASPSRLVTHERAVPVKTIRDVRKMDRGLADMLLEHEIFVQEIERKGLSVIGGGLYELSKE